MENNFNDNLKNNKSAKLDSNNNNRFDFEIVEQYVEQGDEKRYEER